eukprot:TRINITY_DN9389_c0_g1_i1.p1 TRINITY_DN9389_c0_g1~~TRINITY_DN9389_c0_g1_i1.p1  ORF type:complete len:181 (-),score=92.29 TRINITY_DN9389_c0_g1_i1:417-959(-)
MSHELLDLEEWMMVLNKMLKFHFNISEEIKAVVQAIRQEMKPELIPLAEDKANFGKLVKKAIREMWSLEYEVDELQAKFAESIGKLDLENLDVDFIEDMMLKSKPLQSVLHDIRERQKAKLDEIKKTYGEAIKDLEPMKVARPAKNELPAAPADAPPAGDKPAEPAPAAAPAPAPVAATA